MQAGLAFEGQCEKEEIDICIKKALERTDCTTIDPRKSVISCV